jgi:hypothetical protein
MKRIATIIAVTLLLTSCYSYKIFPVAYRDFCYNGEKQTAYILNPELAKEKEILKGAGIFAFTDSLSKDCMTIKLRPLERRLSCGQPIIASLFTLGQVPVYFTDRYNYQFDEIEHGDTILKRFELLVAQRTWFWDMFKVHKRFNQQASQALLASYYLKPVDLSASVTTH